MDHEDSKLSWKEFFRPNRFELSVGLVMAVLALVGLVWSRVDVKSFKHVYVVEDGPIEWLTVVFLLGVVVITLRRFLRLRAVRSRLFLACLLGFAAVFFFGAGEEISWGQRLLGFGTPEAIKQYNTQDEFTVHNLQFGEIRLNKLIFGLLLTIIVVVYVLVLPVLWRLWPPVRGLADTFAIPVPRGFSAIVVALLAPVVDFMPSQNRWELLELIVVSAVFLAVLRPLNRRIFERDPS
jgi:hypothetical protein